MEVINYIIPAIVAGILVFFFSMLQSKDAKKYEELFNQLKEQLEKEQKRSDRLQSALANREPYIPDVTMDDFEKAIGEAEEEVERDTSITGGRI
jgi:hypothetical protein